MSQNKDDFYGRTVGPDGERVILTGSNLAGVSMAGMDLKLIRERDGIKHWHVPSNLEMPDDK